MSAPRHNLELIAYARYVDFCTSLGQHWLPIGEWRKVSASIVPNHYESFHMEGSFRRLRGATRIAAQ
jgi:hypothetical protein